MEQITDKDFCSEQKPLSRKVGERRGSIVLAVLVHEVDVRRTTVKRHHLDAPVDSANLGEGSFLVPAAPRRPSKQCKNGGGEWETKNIYPTRMEETRGGDRSRKNNYYNLR